MSFLSSWGRGYSAMFLNIRQKVSNRLAGVVHANLSSSVGRRYLPYRILLNSLFEGNRAIIQRYQNRLMIKKSLKSKNTASNFLYTELHVHIIERKK